ncbi:MAG: class I SAM-dependent methyltransferase [Hyphomicrobiaceae bacterium]
MSGFSPEWLALREPADVRARDPGLLAALAAHLAGREPIEVVDLGCGTGANIRATAPVLGPVQTWTLVDHDPVLLEAARTALLAWADEASENGEAIALRKAGRAIAVRFRQADLMQNLEAVVGGQPDLVTASALFDLCSVDFIRRLARAVAAEGAAFYTVLTYDGVQTWSPAHPADADMTAAFNAHQETDKGFGSAAGPAAPEALALAFRAQGYAVLEAPSPWRIDSSEQALLEMLADGFAAAVAEIGRVAPDTIADWLAVRRNGSVVGHIDTLALPPG